MSTWVEIIRVRSSGTVVSQALPAIKQRVELYGMETNEAELFLLKHDVFKGDLAVVILWRNATRPEPSLLGHMLADQIRSLGTVDHAVWGHVNEGIG